MPYKTSLSFVVIYQGQLIFKWPSALSKIGLIEYTHNIHRVASCAKDSFVKQLHIKKGTLLLKIRTKLFNLLCDS